MNDYNYKFILPELRDEISLRISRLREIMVEASVDALLVSANPNLFYCSGRMFRGYVYVPIKGRPLYFVIRPNYFTPEEDLIYIRKPELIPDELAKRGFPVAKSIGLEEDELPYSDIKRLAHVFGEDVSIVNSTTILRKARMRKTPYEIAKMKEDGIHQCEVYRRITGLYTSDMTDLEFQIEIERELRKEGCLGFSRMAGNLMEINLGSVINGDNADVPAPYEFAMGGAGIDPSLPGGADGSIMHPGTTVMVDMNGSFNGYQTDMTRVWKIGEIPEIAYKAHECSRKILRVLEKIAIPGTPIADLYNRAAAIAEEEGLSDYFMGHNQKAGFIGHGVGIELNEQPAITGRSKVIVEESMTLAIEPKFVIPHVGALGIENTYVVRKDGLENITVFHEEIEDLI